MMKELATILDLNGITCTGCTSKENIEKFQNKNPDVIRSFKNPVHSRGGIAVLKGNVAPDGAVTKAVCNSGKHTSIQRSGEKYMKASRMH